MNLTEAIQSIDFDEVIDRMNAYAFSQLKSVGVKTFNGKEPIDFVGEVILKVMEGQRDWSKANCSFTEFLFGCLRSEISNFFKTNKNIYDNELPEISTTDQSFSVEPIRNSISEILKLEGADDEELTVFEYWADGITKPSEIAKDLGISVKEVYNITKRLKRRLPKIQTQVKNII